MRLVSQMELRLKEAAKLGFKRAIVPKGQTYPSDLGLDIISVNRVIDAIVVAIPNNQNADEPQEEESEQKNPSPTGEG